MKQWRSDYHWTFLTGAVSGQTDNMLSDACAVKWKPEFSGPDPSVSAIGDPD